MLKTLFNPRGTIDNKSYWRACQVLFGVYILALLSWMWSLALLGLIASDNARNLFMATSLSSGIIFFMYAYFCVYGKRLKSVGLSRLWLLLIYPAYWFGGALMGRYLLKNYTAIGYDNILWKIMVAEHTPTIMRVITGGLYGLFITSPVLVSIVICSLVVGFLKKPNMNRLAPAVS